jgi:hypothetical protein
MYAGVYDTLVGSVAVSFLYFVTEIGMTMTTYSIFNGVSTFIKGVVCPAILYAARKWNWERLNCGLCSVVFMAFGYIILSLGPQISLIWVSAVVGSPMLTTFAVIRNLQVKLVASDEFGKLFAYDGLIQVTLNTLSTIVYNNMYVWSLPFWPQFFAAISAFISILTIIVTAVVIILLQKNRPSLLA